MAGEPPPYRLWDFGNVQYLQFLGTGETLCVYDGEGEAALEGGPFDFATHEDEAVLVGREGSDAERALHLARTVIPTRMDLAMREGYAEAQLCLELPESPACSQSARRWVEDLRCEYVGRALEVPLAGPGIAQVFSVLLAFPCDFASLASTLLPPSRRREAETEADFRFRPFPEAVSEVPVCHT